MGGTAASAKRSGSQAEVDVRESLSTALNGLERLS